VCMLHVAVARSSWRQCDIRYHNSGFVDDVMFSHNRANRQNQRRRVGFVKFARWRHRGRSLPSPTASSGVVLQVPEGWGGSPKIFLSFINLRPCIVFYMSMCFWVLSPNCILPYSNSALRLRFLSALFCILAVYARLSKDELNSSRDEVWKHGLRKWFTSC